MSHTSGLPEFERPVPPIPMETMYDWNKVVKILASQKTLWEPGKDWAYHELTQGFLVGEVVRRITGKTLGTFFRDEVAVPIGADFYIGLPEKHEKRVGQITPLPELKPGELGYMPPEVQAEQAKYFPSLPALATRNRAFRAAEIPAANGHGNARSIARIISTVTCDGELDGIRFFGSPTIQKALQEQYYGTPKSWGTPIRFGLGFGLNSKELPIGPNNRVLYWAGWGGSLSVMDLDAKLSFSYVMNKMEADPKPRLVPIIGALYQSLYS
jgi:CubicO group peptidase (beta-lactamase class C family)